MQVMEVPTQINFSPLSRQYTLEEFWALPEREDHARYELIGDTYSWFHRRNHLTGISRLN